jgi:hypothetical protein
MFDALPCLELLLHAHMIPPHGAVIDVCMLCNRLSRHLPGPILPCMHACPAPHKAEKRRVWNRQEKSLIAGSVRESEPHSPDSKRDRLSCRMWGRVVYAITAAKGYRPAATTSYPTKRSDNVQVQMVGTTWRPGVKLDDNRGPIRLVSELGAAPRLQACFRF